MTHAMSRARVSTFAVLLALGAAPVALGGYVKPGHHAGPAHMSQPRGGNNNGGGGNRQAAAAAMHQQQAMMRQQQAAMIRQQQAAAQQQQVRRNQQAAAQRQQATLNPTSTVAGAPGAIGTTGTGTTTGVHGTGTLAGLSNPRFSSGRQYVPYQRGGNYAHRNNRNGNQNGQLVQTLHTAINHLNQADHDYQGHRAKAVHSLTQAVHALQPNSGNANNMGRASLVSGTGNRNGTGTGNANGAQQRMPQAQSDQHLRTAHQTLMGLQQHMSNGGNSSHQRAYNHVQQAARELRTALTIK